jgi:type I restriction enzyme S subunit
VVLVAGNNAQGNFHVSRFAGKFNAYQRTYVLTAKDGFDIDYIYYALKMELKRLREKSQGSQTKFLTMPILTGIYLRDLDFDEQSSISGVLNVIDAKIDCNNRINAELEAMAKMLYDYWFVQFDFPDANGKPYKSSGGKMVYNVALKREIPEGWETLELSDVISRSGTGLNPRENFQLGHGKNYYVTIKNVTNGKITLDDKCDRVDDEALKIIDRRSQLQVGDVLFTSIEPVGVTYLIQKKPENWNINESVFTIRPDYKKTTSEHLFCLLSSSEMKVFTKNSATGSIHKGIRHGVLKKFPLAYSNKALIDGFSLAVRPMLKQMDVLENQNQQLAQLRDWLLPLLMNGQVTVA